MNKVLLISPHFDDAILSAGQFIADRPDCEIVTVCGGEPDFEISTPYDLKCGFKNAKDAVAVRRMENDEATALLQATKIDLTFPDGQYGEEVTEKDITRALQTIVDNEDYDMILGPVGLGHPDHIKVSNALLKVKTDLAIYLWEDLPLRVVEPELVQPRLEELGLDRTLHGMGTTGNKMAKKIRALLCYKSQIGTGILDPYLLYVPERFYKAR